MCPCPNPCQKLFNIVFYVIGFFCSVFFCLFTVLCFNNSLFLLEKWEQSDGGSKCHSLCPWNCWTTKPSLPHVLSVQIRDCRSSSYLSQQGLLCGGLEICWKVHHGSMLTKAKSENSHHQQNNKEKAPVVASDNCLGVCLRLLSCGSEASPESDCPVF